MIILIGLILLTLAGIIVPLVLFYNGVHSDFLFGILISTIFCGTIFWVAFTVIIFSCVVFEKELISQKNEIEILTKKMDDCKDKRMSFDTFYYRYYVELEGKIDAYNNDISFIGKNNKNYNNPFYLHFSRDIDEKKYPYIDKVKVLNIKE